MTQAASRTAPPPRPFSRDRWVWSGLALLLILWSYAGVRDGLFGFLRGEDWGQMADYAARLWPPALEGDFLRLVARAALETFAISVAGSAMSVLLAGAFLYFASSDELLGAGGETEAKSLRRTASRRALFYLARAALNLFRTVPELVWAIFFVFAVGLGPFAGVLALGVHNGGVLGKLYAETMENVRRSPVEALRAGGAKRSAAFLYGVIPQALPQLIAYTFYRWEVSIRAAAILGFVGAGGLGQQMHIAISLFLDSRLVTLIFAIFILVNAVDLASGYLRRKLGAAL